MIYLFQKIDKEKALEYFDKAIKYAKPKSNYHTSFALLHKGLIKRDLGLVEEAESCASEAAELSPDFAEAMYQNAQYNALLDKPDKSVQLLKKAIELDVNYCEKTLREKDFEKIEPNITNMFIQLRDKQAAKVHDGFSLISKKMDSFDALVQDIGSEKSIKVEDRDVRNCSNRIKEVMRRNSYRDYLEANRLIESFGPLFEKMRTSLRTQLKQIIQSYHSDIRNLKEDKAKRTSKSIDRLGYLWWGIPVSLFFGIRACIIEGPMKKGPMDPGHAYWEFVTITFWGIVITTAAYHIFKAAIKSSGEEVPTEVTSIESKIDRMDRLIGSLNEI
jgi:tetratricopeptide (TPR) repeat protein